MPHCLGPSGRAYSRTEPAATVVISRAYRLFVATRTASVDRLFLIMLERLVDQRRGGAQDAKNQRSNGIRWRTTGKLIRLTSSAAETSEDRRRLKLEAWLRTGLSISRSWERLVKAVKVRKDGVPGINQDTPVCPFWIVKRFTASSGL